QRLVEGRCATPAQKAIGVCYLFLRFVVPVRADGVRVANRARRRADELCQIPDPFVRADPFAVLDSGLEKLSCDLAIDINARDDQRPEEIALPAFVDPEMRFEHFRRMHFLVTELRLLENFRLQLELDELLDSLPLQQYFRPLLINRDAELIF